MEGFRLTDADHEQLKALGIPEVQVQNQIQLFYNDSSFLELDRSAQLGDGIHNVPDALIPKYLRLHQQTAAKGRFQKFVPASGAASRMFQSLLQIYYIPHYLECDELYLRVEQGVAIACDFLRFVDAIGSFPFLADLEACLARDGKTLKQLLFQGRFRTILDYLLMGKGLNYAALPKGLIKFHRYPNECRTAFEEHLVESIGYVLDDHRISRMHFTVSPEHKAGFLSLLEELKPNHGARFGVEYEVGFSCQTKSTDTIAVDMHNRPFRDLQGQLHFRPGGHGALLRNLNGIHGDLVYIKNIDNLVQDRLKEETALWKKILGGYLVELEDTIHTFLRHMETAPSSDLLESVEAYARQKLLLDIPRDFAQWPVQRRLSFLQAKLNRPIRVCGVVPNEGEPGGAPFWVRGRDGTLSLQIIEKAQVDLKSPEQQATWESSTHFNPVDLVCSLRDYRGVPFDLDEYVDRNAVFISKKSKDGKDLKALELPGLWNGSMGDWTTVFIEVPPITFNPVKTVYDLLRKEHLSDSCN